MATTTRERKPQGPHAKNNDLMRRALAAYFRHGPKGGDGGYCDQPSTGASDVEEDDQGLVYVVLRNGHRTLAVYRVKNDGVLRQLTRWPKSLDTLRALDKKGEK